MSDADLMTLPATQLPVLSFTEQAERMRDVALADAALIGRVTNAEENDKCVVAQRAVHDLIALVEKSRKSVKEPVLKLGKEIDKRAADFVEELRAEEMRLATLAGDWQQLLEAQRRAAELAKLKELEEIERQKQEALAKAKSLEEHEAIREAAQERAAEVKAAIAEVAAPVRAEGQVVTQDWQYEVTDYWALARAHPGLVKIVDCRQEILCALRTGAKITGIRAWVVTKSTVRSAKAKELEV